jgi:hypothetical protein
MTCAQPGGGYRKPMQFLPRRVILSSAAPWPVSQALAFLVASFPARRRLSCPRLMQINHYGITTHYDGRL